MATETFHSRAFRSGDELAINGLYGDVTGRQRTLDQYRWQWLDGPSGAGDIWLIEAADENGAPKLIGHHGIMPVRFTRGETDLLFGKTENTLVRPEYRQKLLYVRYEKRFAEQYQGRYHALFSTTGPKAAIRLRSALGYSFPASWETFYVGTSWHSSLNLALHGAMRVRGSRVKSTSPGNWAATHRTDKLLESGEARNSPFFESFWSNARYNHSVAPRRDREDLDWRFWHNPYKPHLTFIHDVEGPDRGYAILSQHSDFPHAAFVEDIVSANPTSAAFGSLLDALTECCHRAGIEWLVFMTTDDGRGETNFASLLRRREMRVSALQKAWRPAEKRQMPRRVTDLGASEGISGEPWHVSMIVGEGRS
ncbi:MAG: hypothetical protein WBA44_02255 [Mesorhizobium sp.]